MAQGRADGGEHPVGVGGAEGGLAFLLADNQRARLYAEHSGDPFEDFEVYAFLAEAFHVADGALGAVGSECELILAEAFGLSVAANIDAERHSGNIQQGVYYAMSIDVEQAKALAAIRDSNDNRLPGQSLLPFPERLLRVAEAARMLGIGVARVYEEARAGRLPVVRIGPKSLRFDRRQLELFIARGGYTG